tara:strand:- start:47 stop:487 length:441 start_codon:yes stop_codon:yes gene_type:complete
VKLRKESIKRLIREELSRLLEMNSPVTYSEVYPGPIGKIFEMLIDSKRGEPDYYKTRIQVLHLIDSLGQQFIEEILGILEKEIRDQYSYYSSADKGSSSHEMLSPRAKFMDLQYDIEQMRAKGFDAVYKDLNEKATESEDPSWLDV